MFHVINPLNQKSIYPSHFLQTLGNKLIATILIILMLQPLIYMVVTSYVYSETRQSCSVTKHGPSVHQDGRGKQNLQRVKLNKSDRFA